MPHTKNKKLIQKIFAFGDISIDGDNPWDIKVHDERFYLRILRDKSLGMGESYMEGWWSCKQIDTLIARVLQANIKDRLAKDWHLLFHAIKQLLYNHQSLRKAWEVGQQHYDIGNDLYEAMLDSTLCYSCGYWKNAANLEEAQFNKLELICRKLNLKPGQSVLDIGCGWGGLAIHMAENYGVSVTGVTISKEQCQCAQQRCQQLPITITLQDYRSIHQKFDHIVSVGMFEHVGPKNYKSFFEVCSRCLKPDGLLLLHTIGCPTAMFAGDPWVIKYIFPNGTLPSIKQISKQCEKYFIIEDLHNFGADYDKTLMAWHQNFTQAWPSLSTQYDERFYRMWEYYLLSFAGYFRVRNGQLWQIVLSKDGRPGGYHSVR